MIASSTYFLIIILFYGHHIKQLIQYFLKKKLSQISVIQTYSSLREREREREPKDLLFVESLNVEDIKLKGKDVN